jgi:hypothetical protein
MLVLFGGAFGVLLPKAHGKEPLPWWAWALFAVFSVAALATGAWWDEYTRWPKFEHLRGDEPPKAPPPMVDPPS